MGDTSGMPPLIGRDVEWAVLLRALALTGEAAQVVEVVGEPGIGKTRVLAELAAHARREGLRTLTGRATEFEQEVPLALAVDALDDHVRRHGEKINGQLEPDDVRRLGDLLDGLRGPSTGEAGAGGSAVERYRCFRALRRLLELLAAPSGLVLVLDDVHWTDPASADFLEYLLRHPPAGRVLIAVAYRPAQVPARLAAALAADHSGRVHRLQLAPLAERDVARLLGSDVDPRQVRHLYRMSGGNPLYLDALRRVGTPTVGAARTPDDLDPELTGLPPAVRAALTAELASVGPQDRLVASAAAVCGYECEPALLAAVVELPLAAVLGSLDNLVGRDVLQAVAATGRFRFRHPVVRHVVYASAAAGWRLGAHARAAVDLERVGAPARTRAHHVARSAAAGDTAAAGTLVMAAQAVGAQAPATAAEWLQTALRLLPHGGLPPGLPARAELLTYLAGRQAASGNLAEAHTTMGTVLDGLPAGGTPSRANAVAYTVVLLRMLGRHDEARVLLTTELDRLPDPGAPDALHLSLQVATYSVMEGRLGPADERLCRVIDLGPGTAPALIAAALRPMTGYASGRPPEAPAPTATMLLDTLADADIARQIDVFAWLCWTGLYVNGPQDSLRHLRRCRQIAVGAGHSFVLPYLLAAQAFALARLARVTEARQVAEEGTEIARMLGASEPLALALLTQCWLQRCAGAYTDAVATGRQAVAAAEASRGWLATARAMLSFARIGAGDVMDGCIGLVAAGGDPDLSNLFPHNRLVACTVLSESAAARGDAVAAGRWAELAERVADPGRDVGRGLAMLARAYAQAPAGPAGAARLAEEAAVILTRADVLIEAGRAWLFAAAGHARAHDTPAALRCITHARRIHDENGADSLRVEADRLSRQLGVRAAHPPDPAGPDLTPREAEIAALIAVGRSNTEIAGHFVISVRTVETHVSRIYAKLGVTTRAAAVSRLARVPSSA